MAFRCLNYHRTGPLFLLALSKSLIITLAVELGLGHNANPVRRRIDLDCTSLVSFLEKIIVDIMFRR
jgi:hypothetical protein